MSAYAIWFLGGCVLVGCMNIVDALKDIASAIRERKNT
jgi:hypothetical protein